MWLFAFIIALIIVSVFRNDVRTDYLQLCRNDLFVLLFPYWFFVFVIVLTFVLILEFFCSCLSFGIDVPM